MDEHTAEADFSDSEVRSLAAAYLDGHSHLPFDPELKYEIEAAMQEWEVKRQTMDEDDPLYEASEEMYREQKRKWRELLEEENGDREQLLTAVATEFAGDGVWVEPTVLKAINLALGYEMRAWLVADGIKLEPGRDLGAEELVEASEAIREEARQALSNIS